MELDKLTERIIGMAIDVHRCLGPGLLGSIDESARCMELDMADLPDQRQLLLPVRCEGREFGESRLDLLVEDAVIVEIKSVERLDPVFSAQVPTYLGVTGKKVGLRIDFNSHLLESGIRRFILESALRL